MYCQRLISCSLLNQLEYEALSKLYSTLHITLIVYGLYKGTVLNVVVKSVLSLALFPTSRRVLVLSGN